MEKENALVVFEDKGIRRLWHNEEWYYSVVDVVAVLTKSDRPRKYWSDLKLKMKDYEGFEVSVKIGQLKLIAPDGKLRETDCANVETLFRVIQSIPSPNANKFKLWLARVGYERVQEIENPELTQRRMKELYKAKGYSDDWIEKRVRGIVIRDELTDEWKNRGVNTNKEFAILTAEISKATFDMTPSEYKQHKGLKRENLRDHMNDLELIFSMLGERVSTEITKNENAQGYHEVEGAAKRGGRVAGNARKETEKELGCPITSQDNFLNSPEKNKFLISSHTKNNIKKKRLLKNEKS
ncbi:Bro-N domain-containing protein [Candidatus Woesearchaeota archaeon]|nr:Bro-N domain-containing protein [Candidatus Woesearchaeota archaeon]